MEKAAALSDPTQGHIVAGRYRLLSLCGKGGMGSVWHARHLPDGRDCAVKIIHHTAPERIPHLAERFVREAKVASALDSPNAVRVLDYGVDGGLPFMVMEFLEGETLAAKLRRSGRMTAADTVTIVDQVANALARAHALGIVHRDLKPDNVFLSRSGDGSVVTKVLDFGIAKILDEQTISRDLTETGALLGTPHYMSPEQIDGARYVDHRADLWSLAVIAFECITGQRPFQGDGLRALFLAICVHKRPLPSALCQVPPGFDAWFAKCTNTDPAKRCRSAAELAEELGRICHGTLALSDRAPTAVDTNATEGKGESTDSLSGSMAVPRVGSESHPSLAEPYGSDDGGRGAFNSRTRRSRLPSFWAWGAFALLLLASGAWFSVRGSASPPAVPIGRSLEPPSQPSVQQPPASSPAASVPVATPARGATAPTTSSGFKPVPRPRSAPRPKPAPSSKPQAPDPAPSAKPVGWDVNEMLNDRK